MKNTLGFILFLQNMLSPRRGMSLVLRYNHFPLDKCPFSDIFVVLATLMSVLLLTVGYELLVSTDLIGTTIVIAFSILQASEDRISGSLTETELKSRT